MRRIGQRITVLMPLLKVILRRLSCRNYSPGRKVSSEHRPPRTILSCSEVSTRIQFRLYQLPSELPIGQLLLKIAVNTMSFPTSSVKLLNLISVYLSRSRYTFTEVLPVDYCFYCSNLILQLELNQFTIGFLYTYLPDHSTIYHEIRN